MKPITLAVNGANEYALVQVKTAGTTIQNVLGCGMPFYAGTYLAARPELMAEARQHPMRTFLAVFERPKPRLQSKAKLAGRKHVWTKGWKTAYLSSDIAELCKFWTENVGPLPESGEVDWRPKETVPEDYYAL